MVLTALRTATARTALRRNRVSQVEPRPKSGRKKPYASTVQNKRVATDMHALVRARGYCELYGQLPTIPKELREQALKWERAAAMWQLAYDSAQSCANDAVHHAAEVTRFLSTVTLEDLPQ